MHFFCLHILVLGRWTTRQLCAPFFQQYNVITVMKVQNIWKVIVSLRFRGNELKVLRKQQSYNMTVVRKKIHAVTLWSRQRCLHPPCQQCRHHVFIQIRQAKWMKPWTYTILDVSVPKMFVLDTELKRANYWEFYTEKQPETPRH